MVSTCMGTSGSTGLYKIAPFVVQPGLTNVRSTEAPFLKTHQADGVLVARGVIPGTFRCRLLCSICEVVVIVKASPVLDVIGISLVMVVFFVTSSRHFPNQPHFKQVVVVAVIVSVVMGGVYVVLSSCKRCQHFSQALESRKSY